MTKQQFIELVTKELEKFFPYDNYTVQSDIFIKNNNTKRLGIIIRRKDGIIAPTIYMENFYDDYLQKKMTLAEICSQINLIYNKFETQLQRYQSFSIEFSSCQSKITYRLISQEHNEDFLENIPYLSFLNLAITFHIVFECSTNGVESLCITKQLQQKWQITTEALFQLAKDNTPRHFPITIDTMEHAICEYLGISSERQEDETDIPSIYIFSNEYGINGATVMIYPDVIHRFAEEQNRNLYIIPSSIHEILVIPEYEKKSLSSLSKIVKQTNDSHVSADEVLSNQAYYYDRKEKKFVV